MTETKQERKSLKILQKTGELVKIEDYNHNVGQCITDAIPQLSLIVSKQWFVSMEQLAKPAIKAVEKGETNLSPKDFAKIYFNWLYNIHDWCISSQLWWGHRIPAYYCEDCGEMVVDPRKCPLFAQNAAAVSFKQDEDVLDTWFSSGLWPFSTIGWPEKTKELEYFYPTNVLCYRLRYNFLLGCENDNIRYGELWAKFRLKTYTFMAL